MLSRIARQESAQFAHTLRHGACVRELLVARERGWPNPPPRLNSLQDVNGWMACPHTIDQQLGVFDRTRVWMSLRLLYGLELSDFLVGTRHAYHVVHDLVRLNSRELSLS